ncbi:MAG TPA: fumarylacetoacetate hydrolase family protein [Trebonia sp.]|nr:fumarylacetoacetate hydrolase family protein [Trebonia sp.]
MVDVDDPISAESPLPERTVMRYASTYDKTGAPVVAELQGDLLVPLVGLTELGQATTAEALLGAERLTADAFPAAEAEFRPVVPHPAKVFCVGLNYKAHIEETGRSDSDYPVLFPKFASSLAGPFAQLELPPESGQIDYEGELTVVIGKPGRRISEADAAVHVLGYTVANDISMRDYQYKTHQWMQGKAWDACTPLGPYLVTADEVDITEQRISTTVNGDKVQDSSIDLLIFPIARLIATISEFTALGTGDLILTGTPSGVGHRRTPPLYLKSGDVVGVEVTGVGALRNTIA